MQFSAAAAAIAVTFLSAVSQAQEVQSAPFTLSVTTDDGKYTNDALIACHEGAAIEGLCVLGDSTPTDYRFNTTEGAESQLSGFTPSGAITYLLPSSPNSFSEPLLLQSDPSTNVGHMQFIPSDGTYDFAFDSQNRLAMLSAYDDTVTPPTDNVTRALYNFVICQTNTEGYQYTTLNWVYGNGVAQNPSCSHATVTRAFVSS